MAETSAAYTITGQVPDYGPDQRGQYGPGVVVHFQTPSGDMGSLFVPNAEYNVERVAELVGAKVATMEAVRGLGK